MTITTTSTASEPDPSSDNWSKTDFASDGAVVTSNKSDKYCYSHLEAFERAWTVGRNSAPDYHRRWKGWVRSWAKALNEPSATPFLWVAVNGAPDNNRTTVRRLREYLNVLASMTSWDGKDPVFTSRSKIAVEMGCSEAVVSRCARAAENAGMVTEGVQPYWIKGYNGDGKPVFGRSSTIRFLTLDPHIGNARRDKAAVERRCRDERAAARAAKANRAALNAKRAAEQAHNESMDALAVAAPPAQGISRIFDPTAEETSLGKAGIKNALEQLNRRRMPE